MANGLARSGQLNDDDWRWWRANNDILDAAYIDPATVDPSLFDRSINPHVTCWFKIEACHLLAYVPGYLDLLDRYGVRWRESYSDDPGSLLYEDSDQVLVVPHADALPRKKVVLSPPAFREPPVE